MNSMQLVVNEFKRRYPNLRTYGTSYLDAGYYKIYALIPGVGKLLYDYQTNKATFVETWDPIPTRKEVLDLRRHNTQIRPNMYNEFCENIKTYLKDHNITMEDLSSLVGVSRQSLSKYLNGKRIPKVSTMKQINDALSKQ